MTATILNSKLQNAFAKRSSLRTLKKRQTAFSLTELLIAMVILELILLPITITFSTSSKNISVSEQAFIKHLRALEITEQIIALDFNVIPLGHFDDDNLKEGIKLNNDIKYMLHLTDSPGLLRELSIEADSSNNFKSIKITIKSQSNDEKPFVLVTIKANENA
ncbi:MAG: hypothetical protein GX221_01210 [Candidatus Riflebacteria bacterium]|nr:hypothetical protein [Candidatus Riflebacteria bacterium]